MLLEFVVNGEAKAVPIEPDEKLLTVLRNKLGLTGAKEGCGEGECGACTVIMDGQAVNSCLVLAYQARGKEIITIEGVSQDGQLDELQRSFVHNGAVQCGYCTPGMIMSAKALLLRNPKPTDAEIRTAISGNLCRCTGYVNIIRAVREVAENLGEGSI